MNVDPEIHREVLERWKKLDRPPYTGFHNPILIPAIEGAEIVDVRLSYPKDFTSQMLSYAQEHSFLPTYN